MDNFNLQVLIQAFAAFAGAFFAYFFTRVADFFSKLYQRQVQHYNSLVTLESELNDIGGVVNDNIYLIPEFIRVISTGNVYFSVLRQIPFNKKHFVDLYDLDLMNDLYDYFNTVRKLNDDIDAMSKGYQEVKEAMIHKDINKPTYIANCKIMSAHLETLRIFQLNLLDRTTMFMARIRLQVKKDAPLGVKLQHFLIHKNSYLTQDKREIASVLKKIRKELSHTGKKSLKENERIIKKYGSNNES